MSTSYYKLFPPVTRIRVVDYGEYDRIFISVNRDPAGHIDTKKVETSSMVSLFFDHHNSVIHSYYDGVQGTRVQVYDPTLADEDIVLSEYSELLTVKEVISRQGIGREEFPWINKP